MRVAATIVLALLCSSAWAADPWVPFHKAFPGKPAPVVVTPLPPVLPPELPPPPPPIMVPECPCPPHPPPVIMDAPVVVPLPPVREARSSSGKSRTRSSGRPLSILPGDPDYISCADARRGVTMSCFTLRLNAYIYEGYSEKKKAMANACLTADERKRIAGCFQ